MEEKERNHQIMKAVFENFPELSEMVTADVDGELSKRMERDQDAARDMSEQMQCEVYAFTPPSHCHKSIFVTMPVGKDDSAVIIRKHVEVEEDKENDDEIDE